MIILIADDDRLIRFTMKSMLSEILESDYIFLEAENGKELVEICCQRMPDVVFADIKMPYMDGITAIEECQKYVQDTEFVIISGYSEFEYAKRCISLGINEYLLKPVGSEELSKLMGKLEEKSLRSSRESNSQFQLKCFDGFNYFSTIGVGDHYDEFNCDERFKYEIIRLGVGGLNRNQEEYIEFQKDIIKEMQRFSTDFIKKYGYYTNIYSLEGTLYFVFCTNDEGRELILSYIRKICYQKYNTGLIFYFTYFSGLNLIDVFNQCEELDKNAVDNLNYPISSIIELTDTKISEKGREVLRLIDRLLGAWERADIIDYQMIIDQMCREYKDEDIDINLENVAKYCSYMTGHKILSKSYKQLCRSLMDISEEIYNNIEEIEIDVIESTKEYVKKYYMKDVSISHIAEHLKITPNYLSTIFHQKTGGKFIDYLIHIRIINAKRLLIENRSATIKDIALMIGYNSPRHFSTLFQKLIGVTPSTYRDEKSKI